MVSRSGWTGRACSVFEREGAGDFDIDYVHRSAGRIPHRFRARGRGAAMLVPWSSKGMVACRRCDAVGCNSAAPRTCRRSVA